MKHIKYFESSNYDILNEISDIFLEIADKYNLVKVNKAIDGLNHYGDRFYSIANNFDDPKSIDKFIYIFFKNKYKNVEEWSDDVQNFSDRIRSIGLIPKLSNVWLSDSVANGRRVGKIIIKIPN